MYDILGKSITKVRASDGREMYLYLYFIFGLGAGCDALMEMGERGRWCINEEILYHQAVSSAVLMFCEVAQVGVRGRRSFHVNDLA